MDDSKELAKLAAFQLGIEVLMNQCGIEGDRKKVAMEIARLQGLGEIKTAADLAAKITTITKNVRTS